MPAKRPRPDTSSDSSAAAAPAAAAASAPPHEDPPAPSTGSALRHVDLDHLPTPSAGGRKHVSVLRREALDDALRLLASGWPDGAVGGLTLSPHQLSFKWKAKEARLLEGALRGVADTLASLDLRPGGANCVMPPSVAATAVEHCRALHTLRLDEAPCAAETLRAMRGLTRLRELSLGGVALSLCAPLDATALASLAGCAELRLLHLTSTSIGDETLEAIARGCSRLEDVSLCSSESLTHRGVAALARGCPSLRRLDLRNCSLVGPEGVRALAACPNLSHLNLQRVRGATSSLHALGASSAAMRQLSLSLCFLLDDDLHALQSLRQLDDLDLNAANGFEPRALEAALLELPLLRRLSLNSIRFPAPQLDGVVRALAERGSTHLEMLDLNNSSVTAAAVAAVQRHRPTCQVTTVNCDNV
ncbi:hypothetical protein AB1Y20_010027 [Prymnesium parvum]|uniref:Uncharacterized protein n=1 Tax=Prymnesium parvum TaxID=97485 RepID=A0AB34K737_PRYPA